MFLDEARIASGIAHPNVAQIIDLGEKNGVLYLVMEWVDGESVAKVRKFAAKARVRLPLGLSLRIIADASAGLHAAHELKGSDGVPLGVVHRDVSPQNILVSVSGAVKVIDFGIAKAQNRLGTRTRTGVVKGKVQYMAPEQARGEPHDRRVDVWALGVCLYELVTDRLPFDGDNPLEVLSRITSSDPPPIEEVVPSSVRDVIASALARHPEDRFATAAALRRALEGALGHLGVDSSSEDLAAFLEAYMPHRALERREVVSEALRVAESRAPGGVDAFTGTMEVNSGRAAPRPGDTPRAHVRDSAGNLRSATSSTNILAPRSRPNMPAFSARALIEEEPKSRGPLWALLAVIVLGGGGFFAWQNPDAVHTLVARVTGSEPESVPAPPPSASAGAAPAASAAVEAGAPEGLDAADLEAAPGEAGAVNVADLPVASVSAAPSAAPPKRKHGWPTPPRTTPDAPRNTDWLPKESEIPRIAPKPPGDPPN